MSHVTRCLAVGIIVLFAACRENTPVQPQQPGSIQALIVDGAHSGNPHFFFLPPLVPDPSSFFTAGQFNAHLAPTVEVCQLDGDPSLGTANCTGTLVFGPAIMALDLTDQQYQLNWDTQASALDPTAFYRIVVRGAAQGTSLGSLDVDPVLGGMKNLKTGDVVVFQDGRTLPIKVRIENGAFGSTNSNDFVEQVVPGTIASGFLDVTTNTGFAGARFPSGWLPAGIDQVVVIIERIPVDESTGATCLSSGLLEKEGCYRFRTDPDLHTLELSFAKNVTVGVCFEVVSAVGNPNDLPFVIHRREEFSGELVGAAVPLVEQQAPFLRCDSFTPTGTTIGAALRSGHLGDAARAGLAMLSRGVGSLIEPRAAHAVDLGAGGSTDGFSRFGWAERDTMFVGPNVPTSAPAGSIIQATVQILAFHNPPPPVVGRLVTFTVTGANGTLVDGNGNATNSLQVATDANGNATVSWRLGPGPNALQASAGQVVDSPVLLADTGTVGLLVRPVTTAFTAGFGVTLPLTQANGISMQSGTGVQLEVSPTATVSWSSSDPLGTNGSVNTTGLVAIVQGNADPAVSHELDVAATGSAVGGIIKINSYAFDNFPRWTTLVWRPVAGAVSYDVDFQFGNGCTPGTAVCTTWTEHGGSPATTSNTGFVFGFVGAQPGRWQVTARDAAGAPISTSEWVYFAYII
ncbi:MAG TPA: hypothetical protein VKQ05_08595 [Gemmatimonadales bacterium]|nr:hypothetical protein [Gemmatimonadales bacterium]